MDRFENDPPQSSSGESLSASSLMTAPANTEGKRLTPKFSMFEDAMLDSVRNLNRDATLRGKVETKIS